MTVRLKIVGLFFDENLALFETDSKTPKTIKDLLECAVNTSFTNSRLSYIEATKSKMGKSMASIFGFKHEMLTPIDTSLGARKRAAGVYELNETVSILNGSEVVQAWQYYVIRNGQNISNAYRGEENYPAVSPARPTAAEGATAGFTPYDQMRISDGDEVIWRNVSIVREPSSEK